MIIDMTTEVIKLRLKNETIDPVLANDYLQLAEEEKSLRDRHQIAQDILHKKAGEIAKYLEAKTSCHCEDSDTEQSEVEEDAAISNEPIEKRDVKVVNWTQDLFDRALLLTKDSYMRTEPPNLLNACKKTEELLNKEGFGIPEGSLYQRITRFKHNKGWYNEYQELHNPTEKQDATA